MISAQFNRDGTFRSVTLPDRPSLPSSPEWKWAIGWLELHGVDPHDVPLGAVVLYDAAFDEWRIPVHARNAEGKRYVVGDDIAMRVIRRRVRWDADATNAPRVDVVAVPGDTAPNPTAGDPS